MSDDIKDYFNKSNDNNQKKSSGGGGNRNSGGNRNNNNIDFDFKMPTGKGFNIALIIAGIIIVMIIAKPFVVINAGEVGIKVTTGKFNPIPLEPGFHFYMPFVQRVIVVDTKVRLMNYKSLSNALSDRREESIRVNPAISVLDKRGLPVSIELTVQYQLVPASAPQTIATWGLSWEDKIVNPVVRDIVRTVVGSQTAEELPKRRNEIATLIENKVRDKIEASVNKPVTISSVQLREIVLPEKIKEQIERVQIAKQQAQRVKYEVERAKQEAEKKAALATGDAEAKIINAKGLANAITIEADAQAKANTLINKSLSSNILTLKRIEMQGKFNDALRVNKDAKIFLTPGGAVPNIWVDTKNTKRNSAISQ
jgi:regulator of protease activity HflC (stomatin/prohibitin superfamily)